MMGWSTALSLPHALLLASRTLPSPPCLSFSRLSLRPARLAVRAADPDAANPELDAADPDPDVADLDAGSDSPVAVLDDDVKPPRTRAVKMGGAVMEILQKQAIDESLNVRPIPDIRPGDIVDIIWGVPEKRRRVMTFKGIVTSKQNAGIHTTIRILRFISGNKVEITFPIYSPRVKSITVVNHRKVRRAKLYYLKEKLPRYYTFQ